MFFIAYLEQCAIIASVGALSWMTVRFGLRSPRPWISVGLVYASLLYALDPYSWGWQGGDTGFDTYPWQVSVTAFAVILLGAALVGVHRGRDDLSLKTLSVETAIFLAVNVIYLVRDGFVTRSLAGYNSTALPILATTVGLVIRMVTLYRFARVGDGTSME